MLSFASICPHPPIIIPTIGSKENLEIVKKTINGYKELEKRLIEVNPDVILIISPHGPLFADAFSINLSEKYIGNFQQFGDFSTELEFKGNLGFTYKIREKLETKLPVIIVNEEKLDHGTLVPLYYLTQKLKNFSIIPIGYSLLDYQKHLEFGKIIKEEILKSNKKIAVIASGDLSHRLTFDAPAGYSPKGKIFDEQLIKFLKNKATNSILKMDPKLIEEAGECGFRSIIILLGILQDLNYQPEILSYEGPFGVGYLVMNFKLG
ncbi:AmmeMemoRadiSam system protein B [bacterium]|nr:AmmeMemoRadiSam system protein B [bacterium]